MSQSAADSLRSHVNRPAASSAAAPAVTSNDTTASSQDAVKDVPNNGAAAAPGKSRTSSMDNGDSSAAESLSSAKIADLMGSMKNKKTRPLQSRVTTSVSLRDVDMAGQVDSPTQSSRAASRRPSVSVGASRQFSKAYGGEWDDGASVRSVASRAGALPSKSGDYESLFDAVFNKGFDAENDLDPAEEDAHALVQADEERFASQFESEFVELDTLRDSGSSEESLQLAWSLKLKHFMILSSAGKPIWSRHGDDQLISGTIGVIQTIISFYQEEDDILKSFTAGDARFAVLSKGHLHLVAVSRVGETDTQLRAQLEALYMQILSTLTLPNLEKMFINRPSTDLRRPLQGTETLLAALADGFSRGSPSTLLSALESLRLRKAQRVAVNNVLIKARDPALLYGLLVTGAGQLISVLRPKKHSLHPGDLHLIFNMLFEAHGVRAGGGENWVPLCLPAFNNSGFVYMYVSFLDINATLNPDAPAPTPPSAAPSRPATPTRSSATPRAAAPSELAVVLISAAPYSFFALKEMRNSLVASLKSSNALSAISAALLSSRPSLATLLPGTPLHHFLYKSRPHVQFVLPSAHPRFSTPLAWRRLMRRYARLHAAVHAKAGRNRAVWSAERDEGGAVLGVAWCTALFEVYAVADGRAGRAAVARALGEVVKWVGREEERVFVVGGAVF